MSASPSPTSNRATSSGQNRPAIPHDAVPKLHTPTLSPRIHGWLPRSDSRARGGRRDRVEHGEGGASQQTEPPVHQAQLVPGRLRHRIGDLTAQKVQQIGQHHAPHQVTLLRPRHRAAPVRLECSGTDSGYRPDEARGRTVTSWSARRSDGAGRRDRREVVTISLSPARPCDPPLAFDGCKIAHDRP